MGHVGDYGEDHVGDDAEDKYYPEYEAGREYRISFYDQIYVREQVKI